MERCTYLERAFSDHLSDTTKYDRLTEPTTTYLMEQVTDKLYDFLCCNGKYITDKDRKFLY